MSQSIDKLIAELEFLIYWSGGESIDGKLGPGGDQGLIGLLRLHNGLSAFKGGLRVFGSSQSLLLSAEEWNRADLWRYEYQGLDQSLRFFAEDFLGNQFAVDDGCGVVRFWAETGDLEPFGQDFEEWLEKLLADPVEELGFWLLDDWHAKSERLKLSEHLCPKLPPVAKGAAGWDNFYACDRAASMRFKGDFANQIRNVKTGEQIKIRVD